MLRLHLVRHGRTALSADHRFCGDLDEPLDPTGVAMAEALGEGLGAHPWTAIWSSPRTRTRMTAAPVAARAGLTVHVDDDLREISYGSWEGRKEEEVEEAEPDAFAAWQAHPGFVSPPGGETGEDIARRVQAAIERLLTAVPEGDVLIVSHKATLRVLLCTALGIPVDEFRRRVTFPVCSRAILSYRSHGFILVRHGDLSHLPPALQAAAGED